LLEKKMSDKFGFTEEEVKEIVKYYEIEEKLKGIRQWYDGYMFGEKIIYNPWSILSYIDNIEDGFKPYWINTSTNDMLKELITKGTEKIKKDLEILIKKESIIKTVSDTIVFKNIEKNEETVWSFLLFSGYLKARYYKQEEEQMYYELTIPNKELMHIYKKIIRNWFEETIENNKAEELLSSLIEGNIKLFENKLKSFVVSMMSYYDVGEQDPEKVYQAFILGILVSLQQTHEVKSNRESGYGRYDIMIIPKDINKKGIIMELKKIDDFEEDTKEMVLEKALKQIEEKQYETELIDRGIKDILKLAVVFKGKEVWVRTTE